MLLDTLRNVSLLMYFLRHCSTVSVRYGLKRDKQKNGEVLLNMYKMGACMYTVYTV